MKKFTFLLSLLGLSASSAFAGVFVPSTNGNTHVYAIKNPGVAGNYYCNLNGSGIGSTQRASDFAYFIIENGSAEGQYYMKCLSNNKYVSYTDASNGKNKISFVDTQNASKQWKIVKESGSNDNYDIIPSEVDATNTTAPSWNWHGGVDNNIGFYDAEDGASTWTFVEAVEGTHTFNYTYNKKVFATRTTPAAIVGTDKSAAPSNISFATISSMSPENITAGTTTYTVNVEENLPFTTSTDYANAKWFIIDMNNNDSGINGATENYVWTYDAVGDHDHNVILPKTNLKTTTYTDNMFWCIIGNIADGFKIYNKAAGKNYTLRKTNKTTNSNDTKTGNAACVMSTEDTNNQFKLYSPTGSGTSISGKTFCLKLDNDAFYVNTQKLEDEANPYQNKVLQGWNEADGGSTCRAFVPNSFIVNATKDYSKFYVKSSELPEGVLGASTYLDEGENLNNFKAHFAAANNDDATLEQINTLVNDWKEISKTSVTTIEAGKNYRLYNAQTKKWLCINPTDNTKITTGTANNTIGSVVTFTNAESGRFRMMIEGKTLGKYVQWYAAITLEDNNSGSKGSYQVNQVGTTFTFQDQANKNQYSYLHDDGNDNVVGWETSNEGKISPTYWHVVPATTAEVDMNLVGSNSYATAYLPFAVSAVSGAEAYVGKLNTEKNALDMTKVKGVPAEKGFVLVGTAEKATLTIGNADEVDTDLKGTNTAITLADDTRANYLVFGKNNADNTKVGFFKTTAAKIPANKAYLDATTLTDVAGAIAMNFGGNTTGVNTVVLGENGVNAPVFDLSGRRVVAPVKGGVYIQNGKKFIK